MQFRWRTGEKVNFVGLAEDSVTGCQRRRTRVSTQQNQNGEQANGKRSRDWPIQDARILPTPVRASKAGKIRVVSGDPGCLRAGEVAENFGVGSAPAPEVADLPRFRIGNATARQLEQGRFANSNIL